MEQPVDKTKLAKLLAMTTSTHDGEALNAIRMANSMLVVAGLTWTDVLTTEHTLNISVRRQAPAQSYEGSQDEWSPPHLRDKVIIDTMFRGLYAQPRSSNEEFWQWMDSVHNYWRQHERLTPRQYQALRRCYQRLRTPAA
jgi:hypothetical protein